MEKTLFLFVLLLIGFTTTLFSNQDSSALNLFNNFELKISGGHIYQEAGIGRVTVPEYQKEDEEINLGGPIRWVITKPSGYISDNPLLHGAAWADVNLCAGGSGFAIDLNLVAEHRGISYGVFSSKAIAVYPRYKFSFDTSFQILGEKFSAGTRIGNQDNLRLYEGLTFYNIDVQGSSFYFKWRNFRLTYHKVGDLLFGIGLSINDADDYIFSIEDINLFHNWSLNLNAGTFTYGASNNESGITFSVALDNKKVRIYSQYGYRNRTNPDEITLPWASAFLSGIQGNYELSKINLFGVNLGSVSVNTCAEYRYYGYYFNLGYYDKTPRYRTIDRYTTATTYLYPLYYFERPFSQWAIFTELQKKNVFGFTFRLKIDYHFWKGFLILADFDYNYIRASGVEGYLFRFYNIGIGYEPTRGCYIMASLTNRGMNLDKSYPTLYQFLNSVYQLTFKYNFQLLKWNTKNEKY